MKNPWRDLPKPLIVQAPMEDVTDTVFRQMLAKYGKPDIFFTEFTNVDGVFSQGRSRVIHRLRFDPKIERPIIAQIWGHSPQNYYDGAKYVRELGFDGVDINMGCPQRKIVSKGLCGALIDNHEHAEKVIRAVLDGAGGLPVSVKTRIGVKGIATEDWIGFLLGFPLSAITVHGRTVDEKSKVPCHWDEIGKAVQLRNRLNPDVVIIGNGDVQNRAHALEMVAQYGVDGVMIGRALMEDIQACATEVERLEFTPAQRIKALQEHVRLFEQTWGDAEEARAYVQDPLDGEATVALGTASKRANVVKKYVSLYIREFDGARELRSGVMGCKTFDEMQAVLETESAKLDVD